MLTTYQPRPVPSLVLHQVCTLMDGDLVGVTEPRRFIADALKDLKSLKDEDGWKSAYFIITESYRSHYDG